MIEIPETNDKATVADNARMRQNLVGFFRMHAMAAENVASRDWSGTNPRLWRAEPDVLVSKDFTFQVSGRVDYTRLGELMSRALSAARVANRTYGVGVLRAKGALDAGDNWAILRVSDLAQIIQRLEAADGQ
jgi:hypothetical protein